MANDIWVLVEHDLGDVNSSTFEMLIEARTAADQLKVNVVALVLGHELADMTKAVAGHGADIVYYIEHPMLANYTNDAYTQVLVGLIKEKTPFMVLMASTINGRDLAPRVAARLGVGMASDCTMVKVTKEGKVEAIRSTHRDKVYTTVALTSREPLIATIRPGAIGVGKANDSRQAAAESITVKIDESAMRTKVLRTGKADPATLDITEAEMIVAGGRGMGSAQNWHLVEDLAKVLGASVGGTRMVMDEGWMGRERLIGQTGKSVTPRLYIGLGISGAKEHMLGLKEAKNTVAINKDKGAAILKQVGKGVVGDVHEVVPILISKIKEIVGEAV
ncbi:electron transfer flavoprotein subunit alpha/FixB family protein [Phosphitispora sp. TUW77]|uniref:electron transfer flavoprotein subunit alpha/FixB family protein n=1 Tax=Phosphitispora sp. TUW77 TaxID=3152361 RepID=UPI003AB6D23A